MIKERWVHRLDGPEDESGTPLVSDGRVVVPYRGGPEVYQETGHRAGIHALVRDSGELIWRHEGSPSWSSMPQVVTSGEGQLLVGYTDKIASLDPETGQEQWVRPWPGGYLAAVAQIADEVLICGRSSLHVLGMDGTLRRKAVYRGQQPISIAAGPHGDFLLTTFSGRVLSIDRADLQLRWKVKVPGGWAAPCPVAHDGQVGVVHSYAGMVHGLDLFDGSTVWRRKKRAGAIGICQPVEEGEVLWSDGALTRMAIADGSRRWRWGTQVQHVSTQGDRLVALTVAEGRHLLHHLAPSTGDPTGQWDAGPYNGINPDVPRPESGIILDADTLITSHQRGLVRSLPLPTLPT